MQLYPFNKDENGGRSMKAAVWTEPNKMEMREMPVPEPQAQEALVKVLGCGICGTDCHIFAGEVPLAKPPQVLGHEIFGEVVELGAGVKSVKKGLKVSVDPVIGCGVCQYCKSGRTNLCDRPTIIGYARTGGFAQYTTVPESHLYPMSEKMGPKDGILVETLACVINGYDRLGLKAGHTVLILGAGCVGLLWTGLIKHSVSTRIIQTDVVPERLLVARKLGADSIIDAGKAKWPEEVLKSEPEGVDYIIDATGSSKAIKESLALLKKGGTFMVFGVTPEKERVEISPYQMFAREITILGAKMPPGKLGRAAKIMEAGLIDSNALVTTTLPLSQLAHGIHLFHEEKHKHLKIMIDPWIA